MAGESKATGSHGLKLFVDKEQIIDDSVHVTLLGGEIDDSGNPIAEDRYKFGSPTTAECTIVAIAGAITKGAVGNLLGHKNFS